MKKKKSKARVRAPRVMTEEGGGGAQRVCKTGLSSSDFKMAFFNGLCVFGASKRAKTQNK
jgi:hypothetical protein